MLIRILKEIKKEIVIIKQAKLKGVKDKDEVFAAIFNMMKAMKIKDSNIKKLKAAIEKIL